MGQVEITINLLLIFLKLFNGKVDQFITYTGSLTTPPCVENIIYVINRNRLPVSAYQIQNYVNLLGLP